MSEIKDQATEELLELRTSIDNMDAALIHVLAERFRLTKKVGKLKAEHDLPPSDKAREQSQVERLRHLASQADLDPEFAEKLFSFIVKEVIRHHEQFRENTV
jgi:chorismate mutase